MLTGRDFKSSTIQNQNYMAEKIVSANPVKDAKENKPREATPKLVCIVTGQERFTNKEYLNQKAAKYGSVDLFMKNYISAPAAKLLREGKTVDEVRTLLNLGKDRPPVGRDRLKAALEMNGKKAKVKVEKAAKIIIASGEAGDETPAAPKKPRAPKKVKVETTEAVATEGANAAPTEVTEPIATSETPAVVTENN